MRIFEKQFVNICLIIIGHGQDEFVIVLYHLSLNKKPRFRSGNGGKWSWRESNPRPEKECNTLSTCLSFA